MIETLYREPYFYAVLREPETDEYFLEVTCGTSALFEVRVRLSRKEVESFLRDPESLRVLAARILDSPGAYRSRQIW